MKSEKLQFDRSLATDSEATYRLRTKSHLCLDAGIGGTFYSIPVDSYRNFRRILLYAAMRTISTAVVRYLGTSVRSVPVVEVAIATRDP
mgnify:CR=1 FL=1